MQFLEHNAQTSPFPLLLEFSSAKGCYLYGKEGRCLDLISGIGVSNLGHGNVEVIAAVKSQADAYLHQMVYGEFVVAPQTDYATALTAHLPDSLSVVYFVNSGSEATEGAIKLARRVTGRNGLIAFTGSYHGSSTGALSLMGNEEYKFAFRPLLPGVEFIDLNVESQLDRITEATAAVFLETVQGESGVRIPNMKFIHLLRARCTETGALLVLDEIQCGLGRTGYLFAFERFKVVPDILLLGKSLGGGMPLGAFVSSSELMSQLSEKPILGHITTFGGHAVSCAAGLAAFNYLIREDIVQSVEEKSQLFERLLVHPKIKEIRRSGLMIAVDLGDFVTVKLAVDRAIAGGVLVDWFLNKSNAMRIAPPLIVTKDEIELACQVILKALS